LIARVREVGRATSSHAVLPANVVMRNESAMAPHAGHRQVVVDEEWLVTSAWPSPGRARRQRLSAAAPAD
jgi:hypothetical protein